VLFGVSTLLLALAWLLASLTMESLALFLVLLLALFLAWTGVRHRRSRVEEVTVTTSVRIR
jgi:Flp pilus assembly protein TadB